MSAEGAEVARRGLGRKGHGREEPDPECVCKPVVQAGCGRAPTLGHSPSSATSACATATSGIVQPRVDPGYSQPTHAFSIFRIQ